MLRSPLSSLPTSYFLWLSFSSCTPTGLESNGAAAPQSSEISNREAAKLISKPGDTEPVPYQLVSLEVPDPPAAGAVPVRFATIIRNRCGEDATFVVHATDVTSGDDAPVDRVGSNQAIEVYLAEGECVHLQTSPGVYRLRACKAGGWIVMTGDGPCTAIVGIAR